MVPTGELLHRFRARSFVWGYVHLLLFAAIAGTGAGLHVVGYSFEHVAHIPVAGVVLAVAVPVAAFMLVLFALVTVLTRSLDLFHVALLAGVMVVLAAAVVLAANGVSVAVCVLVVTAAPYVVVLGYELIGHRHLAHELERTAS